MYFYREVFVEVVIGFLDATADVVAAVTVPSELPCDHGEVVLVFLNLKLTGLYLGHLFTKCLYFEGVLLDVLLVLLKCLSVGAEQCLCEGDLVVAIHVIDLKLVE